MIRGNAMTCYQVRLRDGAVRFISAYSSEQAAGLLLYQLPTAHIVSIDAISDGFSPLSP